MLKRIVKAIVRRAMADVIYEQQLQKIYWNWLCEGQPTPPPHIVKEMTVKEYARKAQLRLFVETGTFMGQMVEAVRDLFGSIYSIELDDRLFKAAQTKFQQFKHIHLLQGDSAALLPKVLDQIDEPTMFWFDAHYSGGATARTELDTPIVQELEHLFNHKIDGHVILIDDARNFVGKDDYPTLDGLRKFVAQRRPDYVFEVESDIIRLHQPLRAAA